MNKLRKEIRNTLLDTQGFHQILTIDEAVDKLDSLIRAVVKEETRVKVTVKDKKMGMVLGKLLALYGSEFAAWIDKNTERLVAEFNQELADLERK